MSMFRLANTQTRYGGCIQRSCLMVIHIGPGIAWVCLWSPAGHIGAKINDGNTVFGHPLHARTRIGGVKPCLHQDPDESDPFLWSAVVVGHAGQVFTRG